MARGETVSAAVGIGLRAGASVDAIVCGVREALARAGLDAAALYAPRGKHGPALAEAAKRLGVSLHLCDEAALKAAAGVVSFSARVAALYGVGSVAEAAALLGAGEGARIVVAKFSADGVSCAVARGEP